MRHTLSVDFYQSNLHKCSLSHTPPQLYFVRQCEAELCYQPYVPINPFPDSKFRVSVLSFHMVLRTKQMGSPLAARNIFIMHEILSITEPHATVFTLLCWDITAYLLHLVVILTYNKADDIYQWSSCIQDGFWCKSEIKCFVQRRVHIHRECNHEMVPLYVFSVELYCCDLLKTENWFYAMWETKNELNTTKNFNFTYKALCYKKQHHSAISSTTCHKLYNPYINATGSWTRTNLKLSSGKNHVKPDF